MTKHRRAGAIVLAVIISLMAGASSSPGYEVETHAAISTAAAARSSTDQTLEESLGITNGIRETVADKRLVDWIQEGSRREDNGTRFLNHFHNPLADWWQAGLGGSGGGQSAILWGQNLNQCSAPDPTQCVPNWSWQGAHQFFLDALTKPQKSDRDTALANLFHGLGRQVHLVQDAASPAHTRNDPHVLYNYETLVRDVQRRDRNTFDGWLANSPPGFTSGQPDPAWRSLPASSLAPIPIARLLDTDLYIGGNPSATMAPLMGLSEYTNANFFSEDSVFVETETNPLDRFPFPARSSVIESEYPITLRTGENVTRLYYQKVLDGDRGYRLSTVGFLRDYIQRFNLAAGRLDKLGLDESVYRDYAERLLPRAVGYSASLLDYFFRGKLDLAVVVDPEDSSKLKLVGTNGSADELVAGTLALYWDDANGVRSPVPGFAPVSLAGVKVGDPISSPSFQPPAGAERFMAVYQGTLGQEQNAVIGRVAVGGGVEELFVDGLGPGYLDPTGLSTNELYFRNRFVVTSLNVRETLNLTADERIHRPVWGNDATSFMVSVYSSLESAGAIFPSYWAIFEMVTPRPGPKQTWLTAPAIRLLRKEVPDVSWTAVPYPSGNPTPFTDQISTVVLDSRRHILYGGTRGQAPDPGAYQSGVLVDHTARTTLIDYGLLFQGDLGGGSTSYIVYADGADLDQSVIMLKSWASYNREGWPYLMTPFRTALYVGSSLREVFFSDGPAALFSHWLTEWFGYTSDGPVWPHSTRRHILFATSHRYNSPEYNPDYPQERIYLYDVSSGILRLLTQDVGEAEVLISSIVQPQAWKIWKYDFRGSAHTGSDRLFQASRKDIYLSFLAQAPNVVLLPTTEIEQFFVAWTEDGTPTLDVLAGNYPQIDDAAKTLAKLTPMPANLLDLWWSPGGVMRAIQVVE